MRRDGPLYLDHFGLREAPFALAGNPRFRLDLPGHLEAENVVRVALESGAPIVEVVGEVGTGKTLLAQTLAARLAEHRMVAFLPEPGDSPDALRAALADALASPPPHAMRGYDLVLHLRHTLEARRRGRTPSVAFVDEAQAASIQTLEALRRVTNLGDERGPLLQVVMLGQPELTAKLSRPELRQLRQRIAFGCNLDAMTRTTLERYVARRLTRAGFGGPSPFTRSALGAVHRASGGIPRLVNVVCDKALLSAFGRADSRVRWRHVRSATADTAGLRRTGALRWLS